VNVVKFRAEIRGPTKYEIEIASLPDGGSLPPPFGNRETRGALPVAHQLGQNGFARLNQKVDVIGHDRVGKKSESVLGSGPRECVEANVALCGSKRSGALPEVRSDEEEPAGSFNAA